MAAQSWESLLNDWYHGVNHQIGDGAALSNSGSEAIISPSSPDFTFGLHCPPLYEGQAVQVVAQGRVSSVSGPNLTLQLRWGGTGGVSLASTGTLAVYNPTNGTWQLDAVITCRSVGSAGTVMTIGSVTGITSASATSFLPATAPATATVDTTTQKSLTLTGLWGTASSSNTITVHQWLVQSLN